MATSLAGGSDFPLAGAAASASLLHIEVRDHNLGRSDEFMCGPRVYVAPESSRTPIQCVI